MAEERESGGHLIAPICATCGGEIDKTNQGWVHVGQPPLVLADFSAALPGEPDLSKVTPSPFVTQPGSPFGAWEHRCKHVPAAEHIPWVSAQVMEVAAEYAGKQDADYNLITSSGPAATQTVQHLHVHYVPRQYDDGLPLPWTPQQLGDNR